MGVFTRAIKAVWNEVNKPETFVKGDEFEEYVRKNIFPPNEYELLAKTHDYISNKKDYVQSSMEPDFKFRSRKKGKVFFVEAKYRSAYFDGKIECKSYQISRYRDINKVTPVYVVVGIGNVPSSPEHIFLMPVKCIKYVQLFRNFLKEYEIRPEQGVSEEKLSALLMVS